MSVKGRVAILMAIAGLTLAFAAGPTFARDEAPRVLKGEVVAIHNAQEGNGEGFHEITILTAEQEQVRLRLGPMNTPPCPCNVGDPVQVRLMAGEPGPHTLMVRTLKNVRTKRMVRIRTQNGELVQTREQRREGAGTGTGEPPTDRGSSGHSKSGSGGRGGRG